MAESFARRAGASLLDKPGEELTVLFDAKGVSLIGYGLSYQGDFEGMLHRVSDGRLAHEMLVRADTHTHTHTHTSSIHVRESPWFVISLHQRI